MHQAVFGLHQAEDVAAEAQRADHLQSVERELLEELAVALLVGTHARESRAGARRARHEGRAHLRVCVHIGLVGLDLGQRLDAATRLVLGFLDEAVELIVSARTGAEEHVAETGERHSEGAERRAVFGVRHATYSQPAGVGRWATASFFFSASPAAISSSSR